MKKDEITKREVAIIFRNNKDMSQKQTGEEITHERKQKIQVTTEELQKRNSVNFIQSQYSEFHSALYLMFLNFCTDLLLKYKRTNMIYNVPFANPLDSFTPEHDK